MNKINPKTTNTLFFLLVFIISSFSAFGQAVRVDPAATTTTATNIPAGAYPPVLAIPGATIHVCNSPATSSTCSNYATTYTDATGVTSCPSNAPVVLATTNACVATADNQGNFGFWLTPGLYFYTLTIGGSNYGPFPITAASIFTGSSNTNTFPNLVNTSYIFSLTSATTLTGGTPASVSLTNCPAGVKGTDTSHYLYVAGTGTAETVLITGGTCATAGAAGTINFTPAHSHGAGWTLQSATAGIGEALEVLNGGGGTVTLPAGFWFIYSQITVPSFTNLIGNGTGGSTLRVASGFMAATSQWAVPGFVGNYAPIVMPNGGRSIQIKNFTLDLNGAGNISYTGGGIAGISIVICTIENTEITNASNGLNGISPILIQGSADGNIINGNTIENQPGCSVDNTGPGGIVAGGTRNHVTNNYVINTCGTNYSIGTNSVVDGNTGQIGNGVMSKGNQMYMADSSSGSIFTNNVCIGNGVGPACYAVGTDIPTTDANNNTFTHNRAVNCGDGFLAVGAIGQAAYVRNNTFANNSVEGCIEGAFVTNQATGVIIKGNQFINSVINGIDIYAQVATAPPTNVLIEGNYIDHTGTASGVNDSGITCDAASTFACAVNLSVLGNTVTDTGVSPVMDFAFWAPIASALTNLTVANNTFANSITDDLFIAGSLGSFVGTTIGPNALTKAAPGITTTSSMKPGFNAYVHTNLTVTAGANENIDIGNATYVRFTSGTGAPFSVGGFKGGVDGRVLYLLNVTGQQLTINNGDAGSSAGNQIFTATGGNVTLRVGSSVATFVYDASFGDWILVATN